MHVLTYVFGLEEVDAVGDPVDGLRVMERKKKWRLVKAHEVGASSGKPTQEEMERTMVEDEVIGVFLENVVIGSLDPSHGERPSRSPRFPAMVPEVVDVHMHDQGRTISFSGSRCWALGVWQRC